MNNEQVQNEIAAIAIAVLGDYDSNRAIDNMQDVFVQPDREEIFSCIENLFKVIYPGFYRDKTYKIFNIGNTISVLLEDIQFHLSKQIYLALRSVSKELECDKEQLENKAEQLALAFLRTLPAVRAMLDEDLHAAFDGDPAAFSFGEIIISYPGLFAITIYRLAHELYGLKVPLIPRVMTEYAHSRTGIDIHPGASIGHNFFIDHGTGIVIGQTTVIGNNVKIYQGVTLGALSTHGGQLLKSQRRHPTIEDNVTIYSNASILGGETVIGHDAVIGGNAFITHSVKPGTRVSVKTQEQALTEMRHKVKSSDPLDECWDKDA
ncbi:MAG: serine acetyltransferase [Succinivibrio sp.]|nr:serine acetyltransferase [Succinivibrio sp.]